MARACTLSSVLIAANGVEGPKWFKATAASTIYIGYVVEWEDADEVVYMPTTKATIITGVAGCPSYHDNTTAFAAGARVPVWMIGCGAEVWVTHDGATGNATLAMTFGSPITFSNTTEGLVELDDARDIDTIGTLTRYRLIATGVAANLRVILN